MLMAAGVRRSKDLNSPDLLTTTRRHERTAAPSINNEGHEPAPASQSGFKKWWEYFCLCGWRKHFKGRGPSNWVVETRGALMVVATVIATVTFQAGMNPPGGVWQQVTKYGNLTCTPGKAIFSDIDPFFYRFFLSFNTTSLVAALSVVLLLTLGIPKRSQLLLWFFTLAMLIAVTFMLYTYAMAVILVTSEAVKHEIGFGPVIPLSFGALLVVLLIAGVILIYRLLAWMVKLLVKCMRCLTMSPTN